MAVRFTEYFDREIRKPLDADTRYSPAQCIGIKMDFVSGNPDPGLISTSYVERQNLTMRMAV